MSTYRIYFGSEIAKLIFWIDSKREQYFLYHGLKVGHKSIVSMQKFIDYIEKLPLIVFFVPPVLAWVT